MNTLYSPVPVRMIDFSSPSIALAVLSVYLLTLNPVAEAVPPVAVLKIVNGTCSAID